MTNDTKLDAELLRSWRLRLQANKRSSHTIRNYQEAASDLMGWLEAQGHSGRLCDIKRSTMEAYQVEAAERLSEGTMQTRHKCLKQLFAFLVDDEEIPTSPMGKMPLPAASEPEVPVLKDDEVLALLGSCAGSRRDQAIITLLLDSGLRREEVTTLTVADLDDLEHGVIAVKGKGGKYRQVAIGDGTVATLDRYLRARRHHSWAGRSDRLWLGQNGPIGTRALGQIVSKAGRAAGLGRVHTHQLRHTWASNMKEAGVQHDELKALGGWSSDVMLQRYGRASVARRAVASGRRLSTVDRLAKK